MCVYTPNLKRKRKKKYKRYNPKTIKVRISMDVSFLENQLYFNQNYEIFVPLPSHFFFRDNRYSKNNCSKYQSSFVEYKCTTNKGRNATK